MTNNAMENGNNAMIINGPQTIEMCGMRIEGVPLRDAVLIRAFLNGKSYTSDLKDKNKPQEYDNLKRVITSLLELIDKSKVVDDVIKPEKPLFGLHKFNFYAIIDPDSLKITFKSINDFQKNKQEITNGKSKVIQVGGVVDKNEVFYTNLHGSVKDGVDQEKGLDVYELLLALSLRSANSNTSFPSIDRGAIDQKGAVVSNPVIVDPNRDRIIEVLKQEY